MVKVKLSPEEIAPLTCNSTLYDAPLAALLRDSFAASTDLLEASLGRDGLSLAAVDEFEFERLLDMLRVLTVILNDTEVVDW
jgi:hypothetical protein